MKNMSRWAVLFLISLAAVAHAGDWPRWRGPDANGISKETGWSAKWTGRPKQLWEAQVGTGFASFAVSQGRVYTMGNTSETDAVVCLDANTGKEIWKHSYPAKLDPKLYEGGPNATPTVDGDRVYTLSKRGIVHCLDAAKGTVIWATNLMDGLSAGMPDWGFSGSVLVDGDLCILNVGNAGTALDKKTGRVVWFSGTDKAGYATPVPFNAGGERAAILAAKQHVMAVRVKDGKELWRFPWKTQYDVNAADPILSGSKVFVSSGYNHGAGVFDVSAKPPKSIWESKNLRNHMSSSVLWNGHLYGIDEKELRCLALDTGEVKWSEKSSGKGSLIMADGKLIVLGERGELMIADATPAGFTPISRAQVISGKCWTAPVLANGKIYCRNATGHVVCVDVSGK
jgi:outer membrane protein assembly factor BamB